MRSVGIGLSLLFATTSFALPPGAEQRGFRDGANHHLGDDSFVAAFGRMPGQADPEAARMKVHLQHVRAWLAGRPATRPELAAKRAELLGYLDDYIAKGITPRNTRVEFRSPVFIDDLGNICAVGYLIERSVGRALPDRIARQHRHGFLEDIAAAMPEVDAWVAASGMTLEELASIQPGYQPPVSEESQWTRWDPALYDYTDGAHEDVKQDHALTIATKGAWKRNRMHGPWTRTLDGEVIGRGEMRRGSGDWTSLYPSGKQLATGRFERNHPHGEWKLFHESGHLAAVGRFERGNRIGAWTFFHDTAARTPIARGRFARGGTPTGLWKHYDTAGKVVMTVRASFAGHLVTANLGAIRYRASVRDEDRLHALITDDLRIFVRNNYAGTVVYDDRGIKLERNEASWVATDCKWGPKRKRIARSGDVEWLGKVLEGHAECEAPAEVPESRIAKIEALLAAAQTVTAEVPAWVARLEARQLLGDDAIARTGIAFGLRDGDTFGDTDLRDTIVDNLGVFAEWPQIDGQFMRLYYTLAGSSLYDAYDSSTRVLDEEEQTRRAKAWDEDMRRMGLL